MMVNLRYLYVLGENPRGLLEDTNQIGINALQSSHVD